MTQKIESPKVDAEREALIAQLEKDYPKINLAKWKLADWVNWFSGYLDDAWSAAQNAVQVSEFQLANFTPIVMENTACYFVQCNCPGGHAADQIGDEVFELEECKIFLRLHLMLLHNRALLARIAPLFMWARADYDLKDDQCPAFADEFMCALQEDGTPRMQEFFHAKYTRERLIAYMLGEDEPEEPATESSANESPENRLQCRKCGCWLHIHHSCADVDGKVLCVSCEKSSLSR
jgi:hypothetical protein